MTTKAKTAKESSSKVKSDGKFHPEAVAATYEDRGRWYFTDDRSVISYPDLIEAQTESYKDFLERRLDQALKESFPIADFSGEKVEIHYKGFQLGAPGEKMSIQDYKQRNLNFEASLKVRLEMLNKATGEIKEDTVFMGGVPLMTERGTFIINGVERVIVHQIVKADGLFFEPDKVTPGVYAMKIKPKKGAWIEVMPDKRGALFARIDKKRKVPATVLLRAFGLETDSDIIKAFGDKEVVAKYLAPTLEKDKTKSRMEALHIVYKLLKPGDLGTDERVEELFKQTFYDPKRFDLGEIARMKINRKLKTNTSYEKEGRFLMVGDLLSGISYLISLLEHEAGFHGDDIDRLDNRRIRSVGELVYDKLKVGLARMERIAKDRMTIIDPNEATARNYINHRPIEAILKEFFASNQLSQFMDQSNPVSELAHKRRLSALGSGGLTRERASFEVRDVHPTQYGRICPIATPEGPNIGLVLHFASYAKVDKYGFILTPFRVVKHFVKNDGKAVIGRLALKDIVDSKGKVLTAEKAVIDEKTAAWLQKNVSDKQVEVRAFVTDECQYADAFEEQNFVVAQANTKVDEHGNFTESQVPARRSSEATVAHAREVTHMDVSPKQIMSETTSLIPFLEHDDATRAEMGTNMMRQAVPLVRPQAPIVGTGAERVIGQHSGYVVAASEDGEVIGVDAKHISVLYKSGEKKTYRLTTFERSNHDLIIHQHPLVSRGDKFKKGDILADGQAIENGELALGRNLTVAYMPWEGFNYEDAIVISSRLVEDDHYTNLSINEFVLDVRETKLGPEQTTGDIPNVSAAKLKDLDENGVIRIGAFVRGGDILVGKITPKGEQELSPEERLLRAIFGDKSKDVKDSSLYMPAGSGGKVIEVRTLRKEQGDNLPTGVINQVKVYVAQTRKVEVGDKMAGRHGNKGIVSAIVPVEDMPFTADGRQVDIVLNPLGVISRMNIGQVLETHLGIAAKKLGIKVATPILNGIDFSKIQEIMDHAGMDLSGKVQLYDGKTGDPFKEKSTVGIIYMMKLHHLVEDKIHARSVGPYSMVTQQPLGGKAQNGGQRFGEMECWAIQGYGAANILQEMITIKSDDINGRTQAYQAIVRSEKIKRPSVPESFNVLLKELQALGLGVELMTESEVTTSEGEMKSRYDEIDKIEGGFDVEADLEEAGEDGGESSDSAPIASDAGSDE